jgi:ubiquinone/menaquinone biosynthesis C-methylase UbiE
MESKEEALRLDMKTDEKRVREQALWAGIKPGMRVVDIGCGPGKTTSFLKKLVMPEGKVVGVDLSEERITYAKEHYNADGIKFVCKDITKSLDDLGMFDFIWIRFILEYYRLEAFDIVKNISRILNPDGILCLIDLDYNCLTHFGFSQRLEKTIYEIIKNQENNANFDPYVGRKLYSYVYDLGYKDINVCMSSHHLIFGELTKTQAYNWFKKADIAAQNSNYCFEKYYQGGYKEFVEDFKKSFSDPRRFTYTPLICCRGRKQN